MVNSNTYTAIQGTATAHAFHAHACTDHANVQCTVIAVSQLLYSQLNTHQALQAFGNSRCKSLLTRQLRYEEDILRSTHLI